MRYVIKENMKVERLLYKIRYTGKFKINIEVILLLLICILFSLGKTL